LEAETLIADYLAAEGKARFIIEDDESTRAGRVASFARKLLSMSGAVEIRFGRALDPFGNRVDDEGNSRDNLNRSVDTSSYIRNLQGDVCVDSRRDAQYTRELAEAIAESYRRQTVLFSTNLVAHVCFTQLREQAGTDDLFTVLRQRNSVLNRERVNQDVAELRDDMLELESKGEVFVSDRIRHESGAGITALALRAFDGYHTRSVLDDHGDGIHVRDPNLLFFYQNRLTAYEPTARTGGAA
jgi:glycerol-3-phosphate O-acyltransferase